MGFKAFLSQKWSKIEKTQFSFTFLTSNLQTQHVFLVKTFHEIFKNRFFWSNFGQKVKILTKTGFFKIGFSSQKWLYPHIELPNGQDIYRGSLLGTLLHFHIIWWYPKIYTPRNKAKCDFLRFLAPETDKHP